MTGLPINTSESQMKIKAIAPWLGAKRTLAPAIVELLGPHSSYWEPFCGSMAVLMVKSTCRCESVNDLHEDLLNLARTIQDAQAGPRLYRRLRRVLMHEDITREAKAVVQGEPFEATEERAFWYFINSWLGRNGNAGTAASNNGFCRRFTDKGGSPAVRFESAVRSIAAWRKRLRRVAILNSDAFELLERIDDAANCAIYCDPPYLVKGSKYVHDFQPEDHERLASLLHRFTKARVVCSYYDHPKLREMYPDWTMHKIEISKALAHQAARGRNETKATEVLLVNESPARSKRRGTDEEVRMPLFSGHESRATGHSFASVSSVPSVAKEVQSENHHCQ